MDLDLQALQSKHPDHKLEVVDDELYCDGKRLCHVMSVATCEKVWGSNGAAERIKLIEMAIKMFEDPHYYDYDQVQKRLHSSSTEPPR
jgi:hypothetical protein